jgi:hypothetical protein
MQRLGLYPCFVCLVIALSSCRGRPDATITKWRMELSRTPRANIEDGENSFDAILRESPKATINPRGIYASRRLPAWWLSMFSFVLGGNKHGRIKRSGVASEFAVHPAGEIDASDQVLSKSVVHAAHSDSLVAESKRS